MKNNEKIISPLHIIKTIEPSLETKSVHSNRVDVLGWQDCGCGFFNDLIFLFLQKALLVTF